MDIFTKIWNGLVTGITSVFPTSPFAEWIDMLADVPYIGFLNWFFPVGPCLTILSTWLVAYGGYLLYSIVARWLKVIE